MLRHTPGLSGLTAAQLLARLPQGMVSISLLIHLSDHLGSYALAGAVTACCGAGQAVAAPTLSWIAGITGIRRTLIVATVVESTALVLIALAPPSPVLSVGLGAVIGLSTPPVAPVVRSLYPDLVPRQELPSLYILDTSAQETIWIAGPLLATAVSTALSPSAALVAAATASALGVACLLAGRAMRETRPALPTQRPGAVATNPTVVRAMGISFFVIASVLAMEVGAVARFDGRLYFAGLAVALASVGSLLGGVLASQVRLGRVGVAVALCTQVAGAAGAAASSSELLILVAFFGSGLGFAPAMAAVHTAVSSSVASGSAAEAFGWLMTASTAGAAVGTLLSGKATEALGAEGAFLAATALGAVAAVGSLLTRRFSPKP